MAYKFTNSRRQDYYLHSIEVKLKGSGKMQRIYYFKKDTDQNSINELPSGYKVKEVERTGLPVLKKG